MSPTENWSQLATGVDSTLTTAFFGARYAMVDDPDGHSIGLMSPIDADQEFIPTTSDVATRSCTT
jgi:hypothetical protein